eukprot:s3627_g7.t2
MAAEYEPDPDEGEGDEEELVPEDSGEPPGLDEILEAEAEALAAELEAAEQDGVEPTVLDEIEGTVETAAEALIAMRDARQKLQEVKKDRGFGRPSSAPTSPQRSGPGFKKRGVCRDCGQPGHWAGDQRPGAGLARPKSGTRPGTGAAPASPPETGGGDGDDGPAVHEANVASAWESFAEALEADTPNEVHSVLSVDKRLVGALDSACNRTVCGQHWLDGYLSELRASRSWEAVQHLVTTEQEKEKFKFGNDGVKASHTRADCRCLWEVPVCSLGPVLCRLTLWACFWGETSSRPSVE